MKFILMFELRVQKLKEVKLPLFDISIYIKSLKELLGLLFKFVRVIRTPDTVHIESGVFAVYTITVASITFPR